MDEMEDAFILWRLDRKPLKVSRYWLALLQYFPSLKDKNENFTIQNPQEPENKTSNLRDHYLSMVLYQSSPHAVFQHNKFVITA
jgi:hypothetical protein